VRVPALGPFVQTKEAAKLGPIATALASRRWRQSERRKIPISLRSPSRSGPDGSLRADSNSLAAMFSRSCISRPHRISPCGAQWIGWEALSVRYRTLSAVGTRMIYRRGPSIKRLTTESQNKEAAN
jgi:hypothetical protein